MKVEFAKSLLASYATFKELYKSHKYTSPYQILSEFISYVIVSKALYSFTSIEMQGYLTNEFGFNMPIAVIRTSLKGVKGIKCENKIYFVDKKNDIINSDFQNAQKKSEKYKNDLIGEFIKFVELKKCTVDLNKFESEIVAFVLDEGEDREYQTLIGEFILFNKDNPEITDAISAFQEGEILYAGLTYNISELGGLKKSLTLFLDTEILFNIAGLNGELYKMITNDFLKLVDEANNGGIKITLRYFSEVEDEINQYYGNAERYFTGKSGLSIKHGAMKEIIKGCKDISDVVDKRTEMYRRLHLEHGIRAEEGFDYYKASNMEYNLEDKELDNYPISDQSNYEAIRFCSHINVLRKGEKTVDLFSSKYLFVTGTRRVLDVSRALTDKNVNSSNSERYCGFAVGLHYITNLLWYKLNRGFGATSFPNNLDAVIKARIILSGYISQEITSTFNEITKKAESGELTKDQAAAYIFALREKTTLPEALSAETIENNLDFSDEYFNRFAESISHNTRLLEERDDTIKVLSEDVEKLKMQLSQANDSNVKKQQQIDSLSEKINIIEEREAKKARERIIIKCIIRLIWAITWKILVVLLVAFIIWLICRITGADFGTWLSVGIGVAGISGMSVAIIKKDLKKFNEGCGQQDKNLIIKK